MRSLNKNPTNSELAEMQKEVESQDNPGKVDFAEFLTAMSKRNIDTSCEEEIMDAFMVLENNKATMETEALKQIVKKGKDGLQDEEIEEMFKLLDPQKTGSFRIEDFIKIITDSMQYNEIK